MCVNNISTLQTFNTGESTELRMFLFHQILVLSLSNIFICPCKGVTSKEIQN